MSISSLTIFRNGASCSLFTLVGEGMKIRPKQNKTKYCPVKLEKIKTILL
jgi:hypothetical protein